MSIQLFILLYQFNNKIYQTHITTFKSHKTFKNKIYKMFIIYTGQVTIIILKVIALPNQPLAQFHLKPLFSLLDLTQVVISHLMEKILIYGTDFNSVFFSKNMTFIFQQCIFLSCFFLTPEMKQSIKIYQELKQ